MERGGSHGPQKATCHSPLRERPSMSAATSMVEARCMARALAPWRGLCSLAVMMSLVRMCFLFLGQTTPDAPESGVVRPSSPTEVAALRNSSKGAGGQLQCGAGLTRQLLSASSSHFFLPVLQHHNLPTDLMEKTPPHHKALHHYMEVSVQSQNVTSASILVTVLHFSVGNLREPYDLQSAHHNLPKDRAGRRVSHTHAHYPRGADTVRTQLTGISNPLSPSRATQAS